MSESNNNVPMRITQLEEATSYPEGSYIPIAKTGWGTKKINAAVPTPSVLNLQKELMSDSGQTYGLSDLTYQSKWYIRTNGTIGNNKIGNRLGWLKCEPYSIYNVLISPAYNDFKIAYAKTTPALEVQLYDVQLDNTSELTIKIPSDAAFLVIQYSDETEEMEISSEIYRFATIDDMEEANEKIDALENGIFEVPISNNWTQGYLNSSGGINSISGYYVSDFIDVSAFLSADIHTYLSANMYVCGYNKEKNFVKNYGTVTGGNQNFDIQNADLRGVSYLRMTVANTYQSTVTVKGKIFESISSLAEETEITTKKIEESLSLSSEDIHHYIVATSGGRAPFDSYNVYASANYFEIEDFKNYKIVFSYAPQSFGTAGIAFYDISQSFISGIQYDGVTKEFPVPPKAKYFRFTYFNLNVDSVKLVITNYVEFLRPKEIDPAKYIKNLYATFLTVGVIGDSLASGEVYSNNGGVAAHDMYEFSWGQFMARKSGNKYYNFSSGGQTTRSWLQSRFYTEVMDGEHDCKAYYIALGQNDHSYPALGMNYLGTIDDIDDENPDNNQDSFYGNYGKIIQKIKTIVPNAVFFLVNMPVMGQASEPAYEAKLAYNAAIANLAQHFENCYLIELTKYNTLIASGYDYLRSQSRNAHYNAIAYNYISELIIEQTNHVMVTNKTGFYTVEFIGTDWRWT